MSGLLLGMSVWPSFLSALGRPSQISTHSQMATCASEDGIFTHIIQCSPTLRAAPLDFSALSPSHKQSTLQMTQCSNCSPLSLHFLLPQVTHRIVPGDVGGCWHPWWQGSSPCLLCTLWSSTESPVPALGPVSSSPAAMGRGTAGGCPPCSAPVTAQPQTLLWVTIQGSLQPFCDAFALCFQLILKNPCTHPLSGGFCWPVTAFGTAVSHTISQSCTLVSPALPK